MSWTKVKRLEVHMEHIHFYLWSAIVADMPHADVRQGSCVCFRICHVSVYCVLVNAFVFMQHNLLWYLKKKIGRTIVGWWRENGYKYPTSIIDLELWYHVMIGFLDYKLIVKFDILALEMAMEVSHILSL